MATWKKIITAADDSAYKNDGISLAQLDAGLDGESGYGADKILAVNGAGNAIVWTAPASGDITAVTVGEGIGGSSLTGPIPDITLALSELTTSTSNADGDHFVVVDDSNAQKKLTKANISLSGFSNDGSFTTTALAHAYVEANALALTAALTTNSTIDGKTVSGLATTAEAHAYVEANALALTAALTTNSTIDGKDVSGLATTAEAHAYVEANALTLTEDLTMSGNNIVMAGSETVDGKDVSGLATTAEAHAYVEANALALTAALTTNSTIDGKDVSGLATTAEAHAYVEANALTLTADLAMSGAHITLDSGRLVDGKDVSELGTAAEGAAAAIVLLAALDSSDTTYFGDSGNDTNISIRGNLTVTGTTTTVNTETILLADNNIVLNSNYTGGTPTDGGITIERGNKVDSSFFWDESAARFAMVTTGDYYSDSSSETSVTTNVTPLAVQGSIPAQMPCQGSLWYDTDDDTLYVCTINTSLSNP